MRRVVTDVSYRVEGLEGTMTFDPGASLLMTGATTSTDERLFDAVSPEGDEFTVVITTNAGASRMVEELLDRGADRDQVGVIDCTSRESGIEDVPVRHLSSPGDLTGISLEFAKLLDDAEESTPVRVGFDSVSTALMYTEQQTLFRFLHVFTARISSGGMLGAFAMDSGMHEEKAYNTIRAVFDAEVQVGDDGVKELRGTGFTR